MLKISPLPLVAPGSTRSCSAPRFSTRVYCSSKKMNQQFGRNETFNQGLHTLLKDPTARTLRQSHMGPARNFAVFHYDPEQFGRIVKSASVSGCEFMVGRGKLSRESYFPFVDTLATEVLMGRASSDERFYEDLASIMGQTRELARRFVGFSEKVISRSLHEWGFSQTTSPPR